MNNDNCVNDKMLPTLYKAKNENAKQPKCPKEKEDAIVEALKHFQMV